MKLISNETPSILNRKVTVEMSVKELILAWSAVGDWNANELLKSLKGSHGGVVPDDILTTIMKEEEKVWDVNGDMFDDLEEILEGIFNG